MQLLCAALELLSRRLTAQAIKCPRKRGKTTEQGERVLLAVMLGMRESHEDWLALGRDLIARGLGAPLLVVANGTPCDQGNEQCWPGSDRQRCCVHRARNL
jgi:transposase-like protein